VGTDWIEGQPVSGVQYKTADGTLRTASAHLTVVCDGMYSTFRKQLAEGAIKHPSFFVGLLLKGVTLPYPNHGHVVLAKPSPVLFYPISDTEVGGVCLVCGGTHGAWVAWVACCPLNVDLALPVCLFKTPEPSASRLHP
jgi:2-polyprenyl-6-methoxyphenol hydroxylase-like FAD-dependent oxidoreductase